MQSHHYCAELCVNPLSCGMSFYSNNYNQENSSCCFGCSVHTVAGAHAAAAAREGAVNMRLSDMAEEFISR